MNILYVLPHCSTGGMPQYVLKLIEETIKEHHIEVVEVNNVSDEYIVQREKIKKLVPFHQLYGDQTKLPSFIEGFDVVHFQEIPETFIDVSILNKLYKKSRKYNIVVTTHSSYTDPTAIKFTADKFVLVSNWSKKKFEQVFPGICEIWEYPIETINYNKEQAKDYLGWDKSYKHVLHVGLFTPGKNQKELIEIAKLCTSEKILFHFVGNQATNFQDYWDPLMKDLPANCIIHGEVNNPEDYYKASDLFYFPSLFELNPIAVKEALSYNLPIMLRKLDTYEDMYDDLTTYIYSNVENNKEKLLEIFGIKQTTKFNKCYVLYADETYYDTVNVAIKSIREFSNLPIIVYMLNSDLTVDIKNVKTVKWSCDIEKITEFVKEGDNIYIDRKDLKIYKLLIQRPLIVKDALEKYAETVAYIDSDSVASGYVDNIFSYYDKDSKYPYFTEGIYDWMIVDGKGGTDSFDNLSTTLEHNACELFGVNQYVRTKYIQTGYFLAGQNTIDFLEEWYWMCIHPKILKDFFKYAPFHEETIANVLLWKYNYQKSLPYIYVNGGLDRIKQVHTTIKFNGTKQPIENWFTVPNKISNVLFFHGVKNPEVMDLMIKTLKEYTVNESLYINYLDGPFVEIKGQGPKRFYVEFIDRLTNDVMHSGEIGVNHWIKANRKYYTDWLIRINGEEHIMDLQEKRVLISLESKSLGDSLAWIPYVEEFRKKHKCHVICSTFLNHLFKDGYPEIEFVPPGNIVHNIVAQYRIGWYYNENGEPNLFKNPSDFRKIPLQKTAADILGLDYQEIRPKIKLPERNIKKLVGIAIHSTAQAKYWNNPTGWQEVVDYLKSVGYDVILLSKEPDGYMGNYYPNGIVQLPEGSLEDVIKVMRECEFFIGIGSGLSWLAWSCEIPTVIISGFTEPYTETISDTIRIDAPHNTCRGCFNRYRLDAGDWNWCPDYKNTPRQFECSRLISGKMVIDRLPV